MQRIDGHGITTSDLDELEWQLGGRLPDQHAQRIAALLQRMIDAQVDAVDTAEAGRIQEIITGWSEDELRGYMQELFDGEGASMTSTH